MDPLLDEEGKSKRAEITNVGNSLYPNLGDADTKLDKKPYYPFEEDDSSKKILLNNG